MRQSRPFSGDHIHSSCSGVQDRLQALQWWHGSLWSAKACATRSPPCAGGAATRSTKNILVLDPAWFVHSCAHPRFAFPTGWWNGQPWQTIYPSRGNTEAAGEGWVASDLSSTEVPAFRSETQQPALFVICMADVSYLRHQEIMPIYTQRTASDLSVFLEQWAWKRKAAMPVKRWIMGKLTTWVWICQLLLKRWKEKY